MIPSTAYLNSFQKLHFVFPAVIYFIVVVLQRLICGVDVPGYATIVALILLIGGIQLFILGIMGEYIARMYIQGKQRPIFIEKDVLTNEDEV